ncbi:hypothetical protein F6Y05_39725 [Bacillus megaterium]|nr:hypothetical protein [Priestia megaterium]
MFISHSSALFNNSKVFIRKQLIIDWVMLVMLDRYDVFYGVSKETKEKFLYWAYSTFFSFLVLLWVNDRKGFLFVKAATNSKEFLSLLFSVFFLGLIIYFIVVSVLIHKDIKRFKKGDKAFLYTLES